MTVQFTREQICTTLRNRINNGNSLFMMGCGNGVSALSGERGGADILAVYSTAILRMKGLPSMIFTLPYYDSNAITIEAARQIVPLIQHTPVIAGLGAHDPSVNLEELLDKAEAAGCCGVMNEPFASIYGPAFAARLEKSGIGFSRELELIRLANRRGMFTLGWAAVPEEATAMAEAGADAIGAIILDDGPEFQGKTKPEQLEVAIEKVQEICLAAHKVKPDAMVFTHGNPFYDVPTARASILNTDAVGYAAGSSGERTPAERAVTDIVKEFCSI